MKYFLYLITILVSSSILTAQSFEELNEYTPFDSIKAHTIIFFDYNNDNIDDLFIMGVDKYNNAKTKLYKNDNGTLVEDEEGGIFKAFRSGSATFSDLDSDGDNDLFVIGNDNHPNGEDLYINNDGEFSRFNGMQDFYRGNRVAFSDIDNDNRDEIFISEEYLGTVVVFNYKRFNDEHSYKSVKNMPFDVGGEFGLVDFDNDGFEDLIVSGMNEKREILTKLYKNNAGVFEEVLNTPFENLKNGFLKFADIDNNGFKDVLLSGINKDGEIKIKLYKNNAGIFEEVIETPFDKLSDVNSAFSDWNNNGYIDLLITGFDETESYQTIFYKNENGIFVKDENVGKNMKNIGGGAVAFSDIDSDGYDELLISGQNELGGLETTLYKNDKGTFSNMYGTPFDGIEYGDVAYSDIDKNGYVDILITGINYRESGFSTKLFRNFNGIFKLDHSTPIDNFGRSNTVFTDFDNDGYDDLFLEGERSTTKPERTAILYKNVNGTFEDMNDTLFSGLRISSIGISDIDRNGFVDILAQTITKNKIPLHKTLLFSNTDWIFTEVEETAFRDISGEIYLSDIDNNGFDDLILLKEGFSTEEGLFFYMNKGGIFSEVFNVISSDLSLKKLNFIDIDQDGYEDLFLTGINQKSTTETLFFKNESGKYKKKEIIPELYNSYTPLEFTDIDNDGDIDILINYRGIFFYINNQGVFSKSEYSFEAIKYPEETVSLDYNNDGLTDIFIIGRDKDNNSIAKLYKSLGPTSSVKSNFKEVRYDFKIYPNPIKSDKFEIKFDNEFFGSLIIEIIDINGQTISRFNKTIELGQQSVSVETGSLSKGFFLAKLTSNGKEEIHKLIIQ